jgi:hypothetical protein
MVWQAEGGEYVCTVSYFKFPSYSKLIVNIFKFGCLKQHLLSAVSYPKCAWMFAASHPKCAWVLESRIGHFLVS